MASSQNLLYLDDPLTLEFQARIIETIYLPDGRLGVILDRSFFYPTGGGQEHDNGTINQAAVVDVIKMGDNSQVVHIVDRPLVPGAATARIDADRRLRHMQHHTAQHLLTQCFVQLFNMDTLSANINGYSPSTIDLPVISLMEEQIEQAENLANQIIYENRLVRSYFLLPDELGSLHLRRSPKVSADIRIVEISGFDYTPCGGTHCSATGQIGVIKIVRIEKQNERTRVNFVAGWQALKLFQASYLTVSNLAAELSVGQGELRATVLHQLDGMNRLRKDLQSIQSEKIAWEAERLIQAAENDRTLKIVFKVFKERSASELRLLGVELAKQTGVVGVLGSSDGRKFSLVVSCAEGSGLVARELLTSLLEPFNGRGGGDASLAQGGGTSLESENILSVLRSGFEKYFNSNSSIIL